MTGLRPLRLLDCGGAGHRALAARLQEAMRGRRELLLAGTPGLEQGTRELAKAALDADVALVVVDARGESLPEAQRHASVVSLLGVRQVVVAVDGMDLAGYAQDAFAGIESRFRDLARRMAIEDIACIPVSTASGDNVLAPSANMRWHGGPSLLERLATAGMDDEPAARPLPPDAVESANQFEATLACTGDGPILPGRAYLMGIGGRTVTATVAPLKFRLDPGSFEHIAAAKLEPGEIGVCQLELDQAVAFGPRGRGAFILSDPISNETVGAGVLRFALRRSQNVHWQALDIDKGLRAAMKRQDPCVLWFTGIPSSGKSTIANLLEKRLHAMGRHTYLLDGDNVRHGLNKDLGFTEAARVENIRRIAEVARLMVDAGLIVLTAFISPFRNERRMARGLLPPGEFLEIFVDTPLGVAEARDPKGLYRKARRGELVNFTGIDSPYEAPENAEIRIDTAALAPVEAVERIIEEMRRRGRL